MVEVAIESDLVTERNARSGDRIATEVLLVSDQQHDIELLKIESGGARLCSRTSKPVRIENAPAAANDGKLQELGQIEANVNCGRTVAPSRRESHEGPGISLRKQCTPALPVARRMPASDWGLCLGAGASDCCDRPSHRDEAWGDTKSSAS